VVNLLKAEVIDRMVPVLGSERSKLIKRANQEKIHVTLATGHHA
jgi:hypothetical protein